MNQDWYTALRQARRLRRCIRCAKRYWLLVESSSPTGVSRISGDVLVGDLSERKLTLISAQVETGNLIVEIIRLRQYVERLSPPPSPPRLRVVR